MEEKLEIIASKRGYVVSQEGVVYNKKGIEVGFEYSNYIRIGIRVKGLVKKFKAHRLQAYQKYGYKLYTKGIIVRHKDGNKLNNSWSNIIIGTASENQMDIPEQIRIKRAKHATSFIVKYDKAEVKDFHATSKSYIKTMKEFGITSKGTLNYILKN